MHKENGQYDPRQAVFDDGRIREENPYDENGQTPYIMQRLLKLAEEAEQQASRAAETANTAGILAQGLIAAMQADFDAEKAAQADKEYSEATEAKGTALAGLDILESAKRDYELYQLQLLRAKNNLEIAQQQANRARQEYLQLQKQAEESNTPPLPQAPPISKAPDMPLFVPPEREPGYMAAANGSLTRNRVSGIALANPLPAPVLEPPLAPSRFGPPEQATLGQETAIPAKTREQKENSLWQYAKTMAVTLVVVVCLRLFVFDVVQVNGGSMIPTLQNTDRLISSKIAYVLSEPQRHDIILLDAPDQSGYFIKRIIGLPNEHIEITGGMVFINGVLLNEEYIEDLYTDGDINLVLPEGFYFVMGDNRPVSRDSRSDSISTIAKEHINGKAILRFYPLSTFRML